MSRDATVFLGGAPTSPGASGGAALLKESAAAALERALAFVEQHGDALGRARAAHALRAGPAADVDALVRAAQRADGSCAPLGHGAANALVSELRTRIDDAALADALEALALYAEIRHDDGAHIERAVRFVEAALEGARGLALRESGDALFATALAAGSLGRSRYARPESLAAAASLLAARFSPDLVEAAGLGELAALALFYSCVPDELGDEALQWCGRELEKRYRAQRVEATGVVQVLLACRAGSLPGAGFAPEELLERLLAEQARDGGFDALCPGGPPARVGASIDAMRGIIGLCATF